MLKHNNSTIKSNSLDNMISGAVRIKAGSFVIDNKWVSYDSYLFKIGDYVRSVITANRPNFFTNRSNALYLVVSLSLNEGIKIIEGTQVGYTIREAVPLPQILGNIPLVGIILRQDGTNNLRDGFIPVTDDDIKFFSGTGNIENRNLPGVQGRDNTTQGLTGLQGGMGTLGSIGVTGLLGEMGITGVIGSEDIQGETGIRGFTGISWDVHLPFNLNI